MNVLISGASMAGLSAAYWFARLGHRVTVVERADGLRPGGASWDKAKKAKLDVKDVGAAVKGADVVVDGDRFSDRQDAAINGDSLAI